MNHQELSLNESWTSSKVIIEGFLASDLVESGRDLYIRYMYIYTNLNIYIYKWTMPPGNKG